MLLNKLKTKKVKDSKSEVWKISCMLESTDRSRKIFAHFQFRFTPSNIKLSNSTIFPTTCYPRKIYVWTYLSLLHWTSDFHDLVSKSYKSTIIILIEWIDWKENCNWRLLTIVVRSTRIIFSTECKDLIFVNWQNSSPVVKSGIPNWREHFRTF